MPNKITPSREVTVNFFKKTKGGSLLPMETYEYKKFPITATVNDVVSWAASVKPTIAAKMSITLRL